MLVTMGPFEASAVWEKTKMMPTTRAARRVRMDFCAMMSMSKIDATIDIGQRLVRRTGLEG